MKRKKTSPEPKQANDKQFSKAIDQKCASLRKLLAQNSGDDADAKYQIAVEVRELRDTKTYGAGAFKKAAEQLGCTASLLYTYDRVARCYPKKAFTALIKQENEHGQPLSFSHIVELTREKDDKKREELATKAVAASWSVTDIRKSLPKKAGAGRQPSLVGETKMGETVIKRLLHAAEFFQKDRSMEDGAERAKARDVYKALMDVARVIMERISASMSKPPPSAPAADLVPPTTSKNGNVSSTSSPR